MRYSVFCTIILAVGALTANLARAVPFSPVQLDSLCALGDSLRVAGDLRDAERTYRLALRARDDHAQALNGLGLVFRDTPRGLLWAVKYFKMATVADPEYWEAYQNMAETYGMLGDTKELRTYQHLAKANPDHQDAWYQIGRIHRVGIDHRYLDEGESEEAFRRQIGVSPDHMSARLYLGALLARTGRTDEALGYLQPIADEPNPLQRKAIVAMARMYQLRMEGDRAGLLMDAYVQDLPEDEQIIYYDLSLVADGEELEQFKAAPRTEWRRLSEAFWASRDPAPVTAGNERLTEHRRRVAYSREQYGEHLFPWDDRGEVYVRYGEPDHVSSSVDIRFETDARVVAVKDRLMMMAGRAAGALAQVRAGDLGELASTRAVGSVSSTQRQIAETGTVLTMDGVAAASGAASGEHTAASILGWPIYPVVGKRWEYWIYTELGSGIEITYTQPNHPGPFRFADPPSSVGGSDRSILAAWQRMNPRFVMDGVAAVKS